MHPHIAKYHYLVSYLLLMKIASWNVNSLKVRQPQVLQWLQGAEETVIGLQELKQEDDAVDHAGFEALGYRILSNGQKTYNGVALVYPAQWAEPTEIVDALPGFEDHQRRVLAATFGDLRVINLYVVNGEAVGSEKYDYKMRWLEALKIWVGQELERYPRLVVMGDFNIAPADADVYDPEAWHERILCSSPERAHLNALLKLGLHDSFRLFDQPEKSYSWWDYRSMGFRRNRGLRIDLILISEALKEEVCQAGIDKEPRGWERPSDHAPAWIDLSGGN